MLWRPFLARVKVNHRRVYSRILAKVCAVATATGLVKNGLKKMGFCLFKKNLVVRFFFIICPLRIDITSLLPTLL